MFKTDIERIEYRTILYCCRDNLLDGLQNKNLVS